MGALLRATFVMLVAGWLATGCDQQKKVGTDSSPEMQTAAIKLFADRCARCHGELGKGDGPDAAKLAVHPRNFADPTWQLAAPDRQLDQVIVEGGPAVGKNAAMPAHPDLASNHELLVALRQHLRALAAGAFAPN